MRFCKGCQAELDEAQFNGDFSYCKDCYNKYKNERRSRRHEKIKKDTCVYFIRSGDLIKIGFTSDLDERVRTLQVNNPTVVEVLKTIPGGYAEEQGLHEKFAHLNKLGEWFYAADELIEFIKHVG